MTALLVDRGKFGHTDKNTRGGRVIWRHKGITSDDVGRDSSDKL